MTIFQAVILAIVQALTEFLPISSSAHLALAPWLLNWPDQGLTFDIALHFGTLSAVLIYFFRDWVQVLSQAFGIKYNPDPELQLNRSLLWLLALATVPVGVAGLLLEDFVEGTMRDNRVVIGAMLIGVGLLMAYADRVGRRERGIGTVSLMDALSIGAAQAIAVIPGTSRSGITITAGLFRGLDRHTAARFSFLLSTPAIGGAALKKFYDLYKQGGVPEEMRLHFAVGIIVSAVVGCLVIGGLLRYLRTNTLRFFVVYRIVFGIIVIALALFVR